jgi:immunity protein, SdpI family
MKISWRSEWPHWLLLAAMFALSAWNWSVAPSRIPVHWNLHGHVDRYGGKFEGVFGLPLEALGLYLLLLVLPRIDPGRANYPSFAAAYATVRFGVLALFAALHGIVQLWVRGRPIHVDTWVPLLIGAMFVVLGNLFGKLRPNWFIGIRTPWTLSSKVAWTRTHRAGGWFFILLGALLGAFAVVRADWMLWLVIGVGIAGVAGLTLYSYVLWRSDPDKTAPAGTLPGGN